MERLENGLWVPVDQSNLIAGDIYRIPVGNGGWQQQAYQNPTPVINVTMTGDKTVMTIGDTLNFTVSFDDKTFNGHVTISVTNRIGYQVDNIGIEMLNGECSTGIYTPVKSLDYFVTNNGINFHDTGVKYLMEDQFSVRVESA